MVVGVVGIGDRGAVEVGRQHAADQLDIADDVVDRGVGAVEEAVVGDRDAFGAAAVADPDDFGGVEMGGQDGGVGDVSRQRRGDERVGMGQGGGRSVDRAAGTVSFWWLITM